MIEDYNNDVNEISENRALVRTEIADETTAPEARDLREQVQQYGQQAADALNRAKDYAGEYVTQAGDKIKDLQNKDLTQIADDAKDFARRKPVQALAISAAAGLLIGLIIRRR